jgi:hypothetical protein
VKPFILNLHHPNPLDASAQTNRKIYDCLTQSSLILSPTKLPRFIKNNSIEDICHTMTNKLYFK